MNNTTGRILIAGTASGCGKTSIVCALLRAFQKRGLSLAACKCGPDYIDPLFHERILGIPSENLDLFFHTPKVQRRLFQKHGEGKDLVVAEGVMGYYDGLRCSDPEGSTSEIAAALNLPVVLVLPCRGMGHSVLPLLKGYLDYERTRQVRAVVFNGMTGRTYGQLAPVAEAWLAKEGYDVRLAGYFPILPKAALPGRHLGLLLPGEVESLEKKLDLLADQAEQTLDLDLLYRIAKEGTDAGDREDLLMETGKSAGTVRPPVRIAAAKDEAFCFYYKDNLELLRELGCEILYFSPIHDMALPDGTEGILLSGGYPELYAEELAKNKGIRQNIFKSLAAGMPCLAECGGFLYLKEELEAEDGNFYPMTGFLEGRGYRTESLGRFGYVTLEAKSDLVYLRQGETIRGHEFHYWDCTENGSRCRAVKPDGKRNWDCVEQKEAVFAGFPHISYDSCPDFAKRFVKVCLERRKT